MAAMEERKQISDEVRFTREGSMDLQLRVERLERETRRLKLLLGGALLVLVAFALTSQQAVAPANSVQAQQPRTAKFDVVEAKQIYIVSGDGTRIASFGNADNDTGYLVLKNKKDNYGVWLGCDVEGNGYISLSKLGKRALLLRP
jgi:hypothetical protein